MYPKIRTGFPGVAAAVLVALLGGEAHAAEARAYPNKPVRFIVPFTPGGSQDVIARLVGQKLGERMGQQVVIDNRSGAAGVIAAELTARAAPDGYTLFMATAGPVTIAPSLRQKLGYDPLRDLTAVVHLVDTPMALVVSNALPARSVADLIALAKSRPRAFNYGSTGNGSISHLTMELFKMQTGTDLVHIPYKGAAPAFTDLIAGEVPLMFVTTASAHPYVESGKARVLAIAARKRTASMPAIPTLTEAGVSGLEVPVWAGILTTAGTPKAIVDRLYQESAAVLKLPEIRDRLAQLGSDVVGDGPAQFAALLKTDLARWAKVVKAANIRE
jgi:tripartite-type tricarboxylate transporter receptor subunit TctC